MKLKRFSFYGDDCITGDCYSGPDEGRYKEDGEAQEDMCLDQQQQNCNQNDNNACAGIPKPDKYVETKMNFANAVFMIKTKNHQKIFYIQ